MLTALALFLLRKVNCGLWTRAFCATAAWLQDMALILSMLDC